MPSRAAYLTSYKAATCLPPSLNHLSASMAKPLSFYDLPLKARNLVYGYLDMSGCTVDLSYNQLVVFPQGTYPDEEIVENVYCFHEGGLKISRCEDYHTLAEYWTCEWDRYATSGPYLPSCEEDSCRGAPFITDWLNGWHGTRKEAPEPFKVLLSSSHFRVCRSSPGSFAPFFDIPRELLYDLGTLTVRLDGEPVESVDIGGRWERTQQLLPLRLYSRYGRNGMKEWEKLVQRLAESIRPDHLTLYLIVSVNDAETAKTVLKPLARLPRLKNCGLWLNKDHVPELKTIVRKTVKRLTSSARARKPFRYLDLPIEIRWRILEFSDLVYDSALGWKPPLSALGKIPSLYCSCEQYIDRDTIDSGMHFPDCTRGVMDATELQPYVHDFDVEYGARHCCDSGKPLRVTRCKLSCAGFCECIFHCEHSAYSSSLVAQPRNGVHPLFVVSKQVNQDVVSVFYQRNHFLVVPPCNAFSLCRPRYRHHNYPPWHPEHRRRIVIPMPRLELSLFLSSRPPNALQHIRYLEWLLPEFTNYTTAPKSAYLDYLDTIELMAQAMNLPRLTLVVDLRVGTPYEDWMEASVWWPTRVASNGEVYDRVLQPLCRLEGLKDFFVYLRRVKKDVPPGYHPDMHLPSSWWADDNDEMKYEKGVMGEDYDSGARGKLWLARYERKRGGEWVRTSRLDEYRDYDSSLDGVVY
ncbi:hypothetical protein P171DRAFT_62419 [Karstenula rhodostoma CBS 690.94]|uniref:Uncharacterized protein n=1 Tax=Karstenula rhodostoma CBS 690.94 TaxID=1392251 RepID=A0A9P4PFN5_9PLEO|nr:hypothetical protein P171DRAFT_62419 [Karstenula rhodostoma CBS 690.94]